MRAPYITFVLGTALACSGEPFTAFDTSASARSPTNAGSGGSQSVPSTTAGATARGGAAPREPRAGTSGTTAEPDAQTGGVTGDAGAAAGGAGGDSPSPECPSRSLEDWKRGGWELGYFPELREATLQESHPFFQVTNRGAPTTLDRIAIRYYFTKESDVAEAAACYWVTGDHCSLAKLVFADVPEPTASAKRYLEVSFPGASHVTVWAESLEVRVGFKTGSALLLQTNDYSFDPNAAAPSSVAPFPYKRWLQATLYVDGELVWGNEPCAASGDVTAP